MKNFFALLMITSTITTNIFCPKATEKDFSDLNTINEPNPITFKDGLRLAGTLGAITLLKQVGKCHKAYCLNENASLETLEDCITNPTFSFKILFNFMLMNKATKPLRREGLKTLKQTSMTALEWSKSMFSQSAPEPVKPKKNRKRNNFNSYERLLTKNRNHA